MRLVEQSALVIGLRVASRSTSEGIGPEWAQVLRRAISELRHVGAIGFVLVIMTLVGCTRAFAPVDWSPIIEEYTVRAPDQPDVVAVTVLGIKGSRGPYRGISSIRILYCIEADCSAISTRVVTHIRSWHLSDPSDVLSIKHRGRELTLIANRDRLQGDEGWMYWGIVSPRAEYIRDGTVISFFEIPLFVSRPLRRGETATVTLLPSGWEAIQSESDRQLIMSDPASMAAR